MAKDCTGLTPQSLEWCEGAVNLPGIRREVYVIAKRDIVKFPDRVLEYVTSMGEIATLQGSFVLAETAKWNVLYVLVDRSPVVVENQGVKPSKSFLNRATFVHPGVEEDAAAFCALANNDDYVYIIQTKPGKYRVLGNEMYQTETTPTQALGAGATDEMGTTIEVTVTDSMPAPFYAGEIVTADGIINPDSVIP